MNQLYLSSIKVLDLTRVLAGPLCTMMLGDMGAQVLKIERPHTGDDTRGWGPPFDTDGQSAYYLSVNRNKWSVAADLDDPADQAFVRELAAEADVVVDNFLPGALAKRGLDPARLLEQHPRLIWCTISGFGPDSARVGYDFTVQAERGWMAITGDRDGEPMKVGVALADVIAGKDAAIAILGALVGRGSSGPRRIVVSHAHSAAAALVNVAQNALVSGKEAERWGNAHPNLVPYQLFDTADRPIVVAVGSDNQWTRCAQALDLGELAADASLDTNAGRLADRQRVVEAMAERLRHKPAHEWIARLDAAGVPNGVVKSVLESLSEVDCSPLTGVSPTVPGLVRYAPPKLDEHGKRVRSARWKAFAEELFP
jgi:crotonobetainyl-CoA:carnitine CoA-transferase CaiB-like acyl-CoA transferase